MSCNIDPCVCNVPADDCVYRQCLAWCAAREVERGDAGVRGLGKGAATGCEP